MSYLERKAVLFLSYALKKQVAYRIAKATLASQGIGWAGPTGGVSASGEKKFVAKSLKNIHGPIVFDVGGNCGDYTEAVLQVSPAAQLHIFEPSEDHCKILNARFKKYSNVTINRCGLSNQKSKKKLYKNQKISGLASLIKRDLSHNNCKMGLSEKVTLETGEDYCRIHKITQIDLLKIDVEGWEMPVLRGFGKLLSKGTIKTCQFEFGHCHLERREHLIDFMSFFAQYDYVIGAIKPSGGINWLDKYDEINSCYYATNYAAKKRTSN